MRSERRKRVGGVTRRFYMVRAGGTCSSSSGEEDGDANWKAAIDSAAAAVDFFSSNVINKSRMISGNGESSGEGHGNHDDSKKTKAPGVKLYQIKAEKLLHDLLDKKIEMVTTYIPVINCNQSDGGVIRLFRKAPPGMIMDPIDKDLGPRKKPRIIPGEEIDEKPKKFGRHIQSVADAGPDIVPAARQACRRSLDGFEAKDIAAKAAAKLEEERVAELNRVRGEKWLRLKKK